MKPFAVTTSHGISRFGLAVVFISSSTAFVPSRLNLNSHVALMSSPWEGVWETLGATCTTSTVRLAKDKAYADAIRAAAALSGKEENVWGRVVEYDDGIESLYGYEVAPATDFQAMPTVLFFHTAAGPQDLCLRWRAACLASKLRCRVFIADLFSDRNGWAWDKTGPNGERYQRVRGLLFQADQGKRPNLRRRVEAAVKACACDNEDASVAALAWCFGGHVASELYNDDWLPQIRAVATFHGVFGNFLSAPTHRRRFQCHHGENDPFLEEKDQRCLESSLGDDWVIHSEARHGFSNPAQALNPDPRFGYDAEADQRSWHDVQVFLRETLLEE